ncbi:MAG: tRNA (guanosine(37)-N1)-methyltransferase TrmD [Pseudomonadota bacterium]
MSLFSTTILTLFPEMFPGPLGHSLAGKALNKGLWQLKTLQIRDFAEDKHKTVDDTPYGGGAGMVLRPDILDKAIESAKNLNPDATLIYFTPRGEVFNQKMANDLYKQNLIMICGRFEGIDERIIEKHNPKLISIGDFVLSGGEVAALTLLDACVRLLPEVIGKNESLNDESFAISGEFAGLLEYPQYTKPQIWQDLEVPEVLLSGDHLKIKKWRKEKSEHLTKTLRSDLWAARKNAE